VIPTFTIAPDLTRKVGTMSTSSSLASFGSNKAFVVTVGAIKVPPSPVTNAEKVELIGSFVELCDFHLRQHQLSDFDGLTRICVANVGLKLGPVLVAVGDDPKQLLRLCRRIATPSYVGKPRKLWRNVEDQLRRGAMILGGEAGVGKAAPIKADARAKIEQAIEDLGKEAKPDQVIKAAGVGHQPGRKILRALEDEGRYSGFARAKPVRYL
jgi:hypothetical protein